MKKRRLRIDRIIIFVVILLILILGICFLFSKLTNKEPKFKEYERYVSSSSLTNKLYDINYMETGDITRGSKVIILEDKVENLGEFYYKIKYNNTEYFIKENVLVENINDVVQEKEMYVKNSSTIYKDTESSDIASFVKRNNTVDIIGFDKLNEDGTVNMYKVKTNNAEGYIYSKYLSYEKPKEDEYLKYHEGREYSYNLYGGKTESLDYSHRDKPKFENNVMPEEARTLYLTGSKYTLGNIEEYIKIAKNNNVNAFVVDIKDGYLAYESDVAKKYSITSYNSYSNTKEQYKKAIDRLKEEGFYVIGRIVAFNDSLFAKDNPSESITSANGTNTNWVSAYSRLAWQYNVELAKEAVTLFGFNEIQYDYVRFPEASYSWSKKEYNFKNKYNEEKAETIQNFLVYASDEIHKLNTYISADVFGESSYEYVTAYGQYWPAISNVVDAISAMPYTDHFDRNNSAYWENPYNTMYKWGLTAAKRQTEIPTPAVARTWITAYDTPYWNVQVIYDADKISEQIQGLYDAGLKGGYITWNAGSSLKKYTSIAPAFKKEYQ